MNAPFGWRWPLVAGIAIIVAVAAGASSAFAEAAATVAVVAAVLTLVEVVARRREREVVERAPKAVRPGGSREAFTGGEPGREDIVLALDLLERKFSTPGLRTRTASELASIVRRPPAEFRRYVERRLDELERAS